MFALLLSSSSLLAQSTTEQPTDSVKAPVVIDNPKEELDTEESLKYMGGQLLFQVRKRLNLTTEEEEKKAAKEKKVKTFNILGIRIERD